MVSNSKYIKTNTERILMSLALMVFVLLTSCPVKGGLKTLAGLPVNTSQGLSNKQHLYSGNGGAHSDKCQQAETSYTQISAGDIYTVIPALLSAVWVFLLGVAFLKSFFHPLYGRQKMYAPVPIFLTQCRLLI